MPFKPPTHKISRLKTVKIDNRPSAHARGYDANWQVVRKQHLLNSPLCLECLKDGIYKQAEHVHHIKKLADYPELRDVSENLMSLCAHCHNTKYTAKGL